MKKRILIMSGFYVPSIKAGGPIQSIKNIVTTLSNEFDFYIITSDRDLGDTKPFTSVKIDQWNKVGAASVYYTDTSTLSIKKTEKIMKSIDYDILYLNSLFSFKFSIVPMLMKRLNKINKPTVLAPRGELSEGALGIKSLKKVLYLRLARIGMLYKDITWHLTGEHEKLNTMKIFGKSIDNIVVKNLTRNLDGLDLKAKVFKKPGELKIVYLSRIHPMKNLKQAIESIMSLKGKVEFNIYGPIEDEEYWNRCKLIMKKLPDNINVVYHSLINNEEVLKIHKQNHIYLLLTLGENFGHAILEALLGGSPLLISNKTPWRNLSSLNVGWDLPLDDNKLISEKLQSFIDLDNIQYTEMSKEAFQYGISESNQNDDIEKYTELFK